MLNFDEVESLLSQLLVAAAPVLSDAERAEVQRFVDVGEYGLALETACGIYAEEKKIATTDVVHLIERLSSLMDIDVACLLERIDKQLSH